MNTFKEAGTGLFSLFDKIDSLNVYQKKTIFRAQIVTELKDYEGPKHEFTTPETSLPGELYPVRKFAQCKVRILDPNMAHEKLIDPWGDGATAADPAKNKLFESLLPTMIAPKDDFLGLQKKDIVFVRLRPGDNNMTYSLQYCDFKSIDVKWDSPPDCNETCHLTLEDLNWEDIEIDPDKVFGELPKCVGGCPEIKTKGTAKARTLRSTDLQSLEPNFRIMVEELIERMKDRGFTTTIVTAWRSPESQLKKVEQKRSQTRYGYHNFVDSCGCAASQAIDLADGKVGYGIDTSTAGFRKEDHNGDKAAALRAVQADWRHIRAAKYFKALGEEAHKMNFTSRSGAASDAIGDWGGDYRKSSTLWAYHGMGWDPAHVELKKDPGNTMEQALANAREAGIAV